MAVPHNLSFWKDSLTLPPETQAFMDEAGTGESAVGWGPETWVHLQTVTSLLDVPGQARKLAHLQNGGEEAAGTALRGMSRGPGGCFL